MAASACRISGTGADSGWVGADLATGASALPMLKFSIMIPWVLYAGHRHQPAVAGIDVNLSLIWS